MTPWRILVAESSGFNAGAAAVLRQSGEVQMADLDRPGLLAAVPHADVLWIRLRHRIDAEVLAAAPALKAIVSPTTGLNHIDVNEASRRGIDVISLRGETAFLDDVVATAEHTLALSLALMRRLPAAVRHAASGGWNRDAFKGREVRGSTMGIVGFGRLGRIVARQFAALGAVVLATDPDVDAGSVPSDIMLLPLPALLERADLVTLHVNLCDRTHGFFGKAEFAAMAQGAWFVNTARGELIDEEALMRALDSGHLAGAALDVLANEDAGGMGEHRLVRYAQSHDNLVITPHIGGCTTESMSKTELFLAGRLKAVLAGRAMEGLCAE
jgi:D-3-phosphoglycerate dehydrogenase